MADAMRAAQMFYINCSYTNNESIERLAEIKIQDKADMLYRDQGWMAHITRFALDSQLSLHFIDKDPDAYYIKFMYETPDNEFERISTSEYRVTEDVNTAAVLLQKINEQIPVVASRVFASAPTPVAKLFMTADGRFRLETSSTQVGNPSSLGIQPSAAMAKVLGWDNAQLYLDYYPDNSTNAKQTCRWYETQFKAMRGKYYSELSPNMWEDTHFQIVETLMWTMSWAHWTNTMINFASNEPYAVGATGTLNTQPGIGYGPGAVLNNQVFPAFDKWLRPRSSNRDITVYYQMAVNLRHNGGHGRIQVTAYKDNVDTAGRFHMMGTRLHVNPLIPPEGTNLQSRMVVDAELVMGDFCEMRCLSVALGNRIIRVCRRPGPDDLLSGHRRDEAFGRFARLGDSVFIMYHLPGSAPGSFNEDILHEFKIVGITEVDQPTTWGPPGNNDNHGGYSGRQQDLILDNPIPLDEGTRIFNHMVVVNGGNHAPHNGGYYGERIFIGTRRKPGDPMVEVNIIHTVVQQTVTTDWQILFTAHGHTHLVGDVVTSPIQVSEGEPGSVITTDLATGLVTIRWPTYQPQAGDRLTHYHNKTAFEAVWRADCFNMRASIGLQNIIPGSRLARRDQDPQQCLFLNGLCNGDPILRKIIDRPSAAQYHERQMLHADFFPHQLNVSRVHTNQGYMWKNVEALVTPATDFAILPYGQPDDDDYWPSSTFTLLMDTVGANDSLSVFYNWMNIEFSNGDRVIDGAAEIAFTPTNMAADDLDRGLAVGVRRYAILLGLIPATESRDGKNRVLCAWANARQHEFVHANYFGALKLDGINFNMETTESTMWTAILLKHNTTNSVVTALTDPQHHYVKLQIRTMDSIESKLAGQIDLAFKWRSVDIVSPDLLHEPERSQDANSQLPILSSYTLPAIFNPSVDPQGDISAFGSTPFGTIQFAEGGQRRYHSLVKVPGGLRSFSLQAQLTPKDPNGNIKRVMLPQDGSFNCQILFVKRQ